MKKTYIKPVLQIENFQVSQSIAWGCDSRLDYANVNFNTAASCGYIAGDYIVFANFTACDLPAEEWNGICYNSPEGGMPIFRS